MRYLRFAAAAWLAGSTPWLLPTFSHQTLRMLFAHLPELTVAALAGAPLPGLVGLLSAVRWQRRRPAERASPLAVATRWATILAILGLARPLDARDVDSAVSELLLRGGQMVALLFLFDGPLVPENVGAPNRSSGRDSAMQRRTRGRE
jgi:hypothetical protein